jgi:hypothetical protein
MIDGERRCMDWGVYLKKGWVLNKSFLVEEYLGVIKKKE